MGFLVNSAQSSTNNSNKRHSYDEKVFITFFFMRAEEMSVSVKLEAVDKMSKQLQASMGTLNQLRRSLEWLGPSAQRWQSSVLAALGSIRGAALGIAASIGAAGAGKWLLNLAMDAKKAEISFVTLLGSTEKAKKMMKDISTFASQTPFDTKGLTGYTQTLLSMWFTAEQTFPMLRSLWDAISAVWWSDEDLQGVVRAFAQIQAKGKLSMEEALQIAERKIPIFDILQNKLKLTWDQIADLGNQGISSSKAIDGILESLDDRFAGTMERYAKSLPGVYAAMTDNARQWATQIALALEPIMADMIKMVDRTITPILLITQKMALWISATYEWLKNATSTTFNFIGTNAEKILKWVVVVSAALASVALTRLTISFIALQWGTIKAIWALITHTIETVKNIAVKTAHTAGIIKNSIVTAYNTTAMLAASIATKQWMFATNLSSISIGKLGTLIISTTWKILMMAARFMLIATVAITVATLIYKNWDKLKQSLGGIFEKIAQFWQKAPELIASWWNALVWVVSWVVKNILGATEKLAVFLKDKFNVDIWLQWIKDAESAVDSFSKSIQFTASDVTWFFNDIKDSAWDAFDTTKKILSFWDYKSLWDSGSFGWDGGWKSKKNSALEQFKELQKKAEETLKPIINLIEDEQKAVADSKEEIKKKTQEWQNYKKEGVKALSDVLNEIRKTKQEASDIQIKFTGDRNSKLAERAVEIDKEILDKKSEILKIQKETTSDAEQFNENQAKVSELQSLITALEKERQYATSNTTSQAVEQAKKYNEMSESQRIVTDLESERSKALAENAKKMEVLEEKRKILDLQAHQESMNQLKIKTSTIDGVISAQIETEKGKYMEIKDYENIILAQQIADKQVAMVQEMDALNSQLMKKQQAEKMHLEQLKDLYTKHNQYLSSDTKKTADEMTASLAWVAQSLRQVIQLRREAGMETNMAVWLPTIAGARANGGPVSSGRTYLVGERGPELFTPSTSGNIIPNDKLGGSGAVSINIGSVHVHNEADENRLVDKIKEMLTRERQLTSYGF